MTELTVIRRSPDPEHSRQRQVTRRPLAERVRGLGRARIGQLPSDIIRRDEELGLDMDRVTADLESAEVTQRVQDDMLDAEAMEVTAVPTFFLNGRRHTGPYDAQTLIRELERTALEPEPA